MLLLAISVLLLLLLLLLPFAIWLAGAAAGVPDDDPSGCYLLIVVVCEGHMGISSWLMLLSLETWLLLLLLLLLRLRATAGVPDGDPSGCYLLNVVVNEGHRGMGVGKRVMRAAMARAVNHWGSQRLYTHVEADNEVCVWGGGGW